MRRAARGAGLLLGALAALLAASLAGAQAGPGALRLVSPGADRPASGTVDVEALVAGAAPAAVVLRVDGREVARLDAPPFRVRVDLGPENREHRFEAEALYADGRAERAELVTPAIRVDESLDLKLRQLYVTATRAGMRVRDLRREELTVFDDGHRQAIVTFERGDVPLAAVLLLDASGSMHGRPLAAALAGAETFARGMRPLDEASLVLFSDRTLRATPFAGDPATLIAPLAATAAQGGTAIHDHLYRALRALDARQGRRVAILLSDGVDVDSVLAAEDVLWLARRSQSLVYWIRLRRSLGRSWRSPWRTEAEHRDALASLELLVAESGGRVELVEDVARIPAAFAGILAELRDQYVLGYYPSGARGDGAWRPVRVETRRVAVSLRTRDGYVDEP